MYHVLCVECIVPRGDKSACHSSILIGLQRCHLPSNPQAESRPCEHPQPRPLGLLLLFLSPLYQPEEPLSLSRQQTLLHRASQPPYLVSAPDLLLDNISFYQDISQGEKILFYSVSYLARNQVNFGGERGVSVVRIPSSIPET